jgi:exopolysaccharide biosynthesis predicted pyruvyltransferase EpsI
MSLWKRIIRKTSSYYMYITTLLRVLTLRKNDQNKRILFLGYPNHINLGDQAQTYCTLNWFQTFEPEYQVHGYTVEYLMKNHAFVLRTLRKRANLNDKIYIHSGYRITDLYGAEKMNRMIIELFHDWPIVFFPQTIYFKSKEAAAVSARIYVNHPNITILCRDEISYETAQTLFPTCRLLLKPDIVSTLIGRFPIPKQERKGILLCMRKDQEALFRKDDIQKIYERYQNQERIVQTDTSADTYVYQIVRDREKYIKRIISEFSKYKVIITDRYHGTIFALIANTPVIVVPTTDHKVTSGLRWFPDEYAPYVRLAKDLDDVFPMVDNILATDYAYRLSDYFYQRYYENLKTELEVHSCDNL